MDILMLALLAIAGYAVTTMAMMAVRLIWLLCRWLVVGRAEKQEVIDLTPVPRPDDAVKIEDVLGTGREMSDEEKAVHRDRVSQAFQAAMDRYVARFVTVTPQH